MNEAQILLSVKSAMRFWFDGCRKRFADSTTVANFRDQVPQQFGR